MTFIFVFWFGAALLSRFIASLLPLHLHRAGSLRGPHLGSFVYGFYWCTKIYSLQNDWQLKTATWCAYKNVYVWEHKKRKRKILHCGKRLSTYRGTQIDCWPWMMYKRNIYCNRKETTILTYEWHFVRDNLCSRQNPKNSAAGISN